MKCVHWWCDAQSRINVELLLSVLPDQELQHQRQKLEQPTHKKRNLPQRPVITAESSQGKRCRRIKAKAGPDHIHVSFIERISHGMLAAGIIQKYQRRLKCVANLMKKYWSKQCFVHPRSRRKNLHRLVSIVKAPLERGPSNKTVHSFNCKSASGCSLPSISSSSSLAAYDPKYLQDMRTQTRLANRNWVHTNQTDV